jgi:8-oxo-dGTP diphosphatase
VAEPFVCVAALIFDTEDRLFLVRRADHRSLFANCWDVVGGHVDPGEDTRATLRRELHEETGWRVGAVLAELPPWTWTGDDGLTRTEYDFLITVDGDLAAPRLDPDEHTGYRWLAEAELPVLDEDPSQIRRLADTAFAALRSLAGRRCDKLRGGDSGYAARVAPLVDRVFVGAMDATAAAGGRDLVRRFGGDPARPLIDFRTSLRWPGRWVTARQADAVWRYRDRDACLAAIEASAAAGFLEIGDGETGDGETGDGETGDGETGDGETGDGFRAAARGIEFLAALYGLHERVLAERWAGLDATVARASALVGRVLDVAPATAGDAFAAMAPPYETGVGIRTVLLNRLGTIRYHRLDAHAAGGEQEPETNRGAAPPYAALTPAERAALLEDLMRLTQ